MRIRTVKPSYMQHEELQDLEILHPGKYIMLTFQGLWMLSDSKGKFEYKPRTMKLEILPFIPFDLCETLNILEENGFFFTYQAKGKKYGKIPSFLEHQRITGKESIEGERFPEPETTGKQQGNIRETTGKHPDVQEGKGREEEEEGKGTDYVRVENSITEQVKFSKEILNDFGFTELKNFDKLRIVNDFLKILENDGRLEYFKDQYTTYHLFKNRTNERKHNFTSFFGKQENLFSDGKWDEANWGKMLNDFEAKESQNKPNKVNQTLNSYNEVANRIRSAAGQ